MSLIQYTIYDHPRDHPESFVVRQWHIGIRTPGVRPGTARLADSLEEARSFIPPGMVCLARDPDDDPAIVETWT